jgi:uncharacterized membrane protein YhhN
MSRTSTTARTRTVRPFSFRPLPAFTPYLAVSVVYLVGILTETTTLSDVTKPLLIPALAVGLTLWLLGRRGTGAAVPGRTTTVLLFGGLTFSWLGDILLGPSFEAGLGCFLVAHLFYIALFWTEFRRRLSWWGLLAVPWFVALLWLLAPSLDALLPVVAVYGAVLGFMAVSATRGNLFAILGGLFFVVSDSMLAFRLFTPLFQSPPEDAVIMVAYLLAQFFIVIGVVRAAPVAAVASATEHATPVPERADA